jgi:Sec-independent protein translocase protein TatA
MSGIGWQELVIVAIVVTVIIGVVRLRNRAN